MKKAGILILAASLTAVSLTPAFAQQARRQARVTAPSPAQNALLQSYPRGGEGLVEQVDRLCDSCDTAAAIIAAASQANPDQKAAIAVGVLRALKRLQAANPELVRCIRQALLSADPTLLAMFNALQAQTYAQGGYGRGDTPFYPGSGGGFSGGTGGGGGIHVSPN